MNALGEDLTIRQLRVQLIRARQLRDMALLREVEDALLCLGRQKYRCCLLDYEREEVSYYVRLLGYDQARVKVQIEFPISPEVRSIQWVPLSHLADYSEVADPRQVRLIRDEVRAFIRQSGVSLARASPQLPYKGTRRGMRRGQVRHSSRTIQRIQWVWWCAGGATVAAFILSILMALA